jgi:hypothetical protein
MHMRARNPAYHDYEIGRVRPRLRPVKSFASVFFPQRRKCIYEAKDIPIRRSPWGA